MCNWILLRQSSWQRLCHRGHKSHMSVWCPMLSLNLGLFPSLLTAKVEFTLKFLPSETLDLRALRQRFPGSCFVITHPVHKCNPESAPRPAPIFLWNPESRAPKKANPRSWKTYWGPLTSGDLKSGDSLFCTTPQLPKCQRPYNPLSTNWPSYHGLGHYMKS